MNDKYEKKDYLNSDNVLALLLYNLLRFTITFINIYVTNCSINQITQISLNFLYLFYLLYSPNLFGQSSVNHIFIILYIGSSSALVGQIVHMIIYFNYQSSDYAHFNGLVIAILFFRCILQVRNHINTKYLNQQAFDLRQLQIKISLFDQSLEEDQSDYVFKTLIMSHIANSCKIRHTFMLNTCFCNNTSLFYAKRQINLLTSKSNLMKYKHIFSKMLIKSWYDNLVQQGQDTYLMFNYAQYLFYKLSYLGRSIFMIQKQCKSDVSYFYNYRKLNFLKDIQKKTQMLNTSAYKGELQFEEVIRFEKLIQQLQNIISTILSYQTKYWQTLLNYTINQDEIIKISNYIQEKINEYKEIHQNLEGQMIHTRKQWRYQHLWFKLNILNKKLKLSELEFPTSINTSNAKQVLNDDSLSEDSESDYDINQQQQKASVLKPFNSKTAIIMTDSKLNSSFLHVNNYFEEIFGYQDVNISDIRIQNIILKAQRRNHETSIKKFLKNGIRNSTYGRTKIFFVHRQGQIIQAQKYLKYLVTFDSQLVFVSMIRPILTLHSVNYIVFNEEFDADGMTEGIQQVLGLKQFNLYLLAPKILYYTKFKSLITQADIKLFQLGKQIEMSLDFFNQKLNTARKQTVVKKVSKGQSLRNLSQLAAKQNNPAEESNDEMAGLDSDLETMQANQLQLEVKQHLKLQLRIPLKIDELNHVYQQQRKELQEIRLPLSVQRLIQRDLNGSLRIIRYRLLRQIRTYLFLETQAIYDLYKRLYLQFIKNSRELSKIVILDAQIKQYSKRCVDKILILKINRFEVYLNEQIIQQKETQSNKPYEQPLQKTIPTQPNNVVNEQVLELTENTINQTQQIQTQRVNDLSDLIESSRHIQQRAFISEQLVFSEFKIHSNFSISLDYEQNIFIKDDNNKAQKYHKNNQNFQYVNRAQILIFIILPILQFTLGFKNSYNELNRYGTQQFLNYYNYTQQLFITYYAMNNILFYNYNITRSYQNCEIQTYRCVLEGKNNSITEEAEFYKNQTTIYHYILIASNVLLNQNSFMQMIYSLSVDYNITNNALDAYNQWQNNMQHMNYNNNSLVFMNSSTVQYFQSATIPSLYYSTLWTFQLLIDICIKQLNQTYTLTIFILVTLVCAANLIIIFSISQIIIFCNKNQVIFEQIFIIDRQLVLNVYHQLQISQINFKYLLHLNHLNKEVLAFKIKTPIQYQQSDIKSLDQNDQIIQEFPIKKSKDHNSNPSVMSGQSKRQKQKIIISKKWINIRSFYIMIFLLITCVTIIFPLTLSIYIAMNCSQLIELFTKNPFINEIYPFWILVIFKEYYFYQNINNSYINSTAYLQILNDYIFQLTHDQKSTIFTTTLSQIDDYFNQDICFSDLLCEGLLNGALKSGIRSYHNLLGQSAQAMLNPSDQRYQYPTPSLIASFDTQWTYVSVAYDQIFKIWTTYISDQINEISNTEVILFSCCIFFIVTLYVLVYEVYFFQKLNTNYEMTKQFYKRYFPNEVVNNQKSIRAQLSKCDIIKN